jgi:hypothetical protein
MPVVEVSGKVASSISTQTGKGIVKFWEKSEFKGQEKFVLWTAWFDMPQLHVGENDEITINGRMSTKVSNYTNKAGEEKIGVEHHINDSVIQRHASKAIEVATMQLIEDAPF